jgi:hypothetical protein
VTALALGACVLLTAPAPARAQTSDACALLAARPGWDDALRAAQERWNVSPGSVLAIIDQESRFRADARGQGAGGANPARNFGYAQANLRTWNWFVRDSGWEGSTSRTDFEASAQFVGWHFATMSGRLRIGRDDVERQYLAYKMGEGGYRRGAPAASRRLAATIAARARRHDAALAGCGF